MDGRPADAERLALFVDEHRHELAGRAARIRLGDDASEVVDVGAGEVLTIPPHLPHKAEALEDTLDVDVFTPPREDWLDGSDAYLRSGPEGE